MCSFLERMKIYSSKFLYLKKLVTVRNFLCDKIRLDIAEKARESEIFHLKTIALSDRLPDR